jgi:hypothetical protein
VNLKSYTLLTYYYTIETIKKNTETLIDASKKARPEVNTEKTNYMSVSHHQNAGQNQTNKEQTEHLNMCHSSNIWE